MDCGRASSIRCPLCFNRSLEVIGQDMVMVPGCEPTTTITSWTLMIGSICECAMVNVYDVLEAIEGTYLKYGDNFGRGIKQKWLVFPKECPVCPCESCPDYYAMLRDLCREHVEENDDCSVIWETDVCMTDTTLAPPPTNYIEEGAQGPDSLWKSSSWYIQQNQEEFLQKSQESRESEESNEPSVQSNDMELLSLDSLMDALGD